MAKQNEDDGYVEDSEGEESMFDPPPVPPRTGLPPPPRLAPMEKRVDESGTLMRYLYAAHK